ncbi:MAG TPA: lytic transglycosylase domain-containing protein [Pyrinomonadaceae bacterium]|nr:lytic transglycosylase domain-containing protein [Pyrinomonadaceae bacterium]
MKHFPFIAALLLLSAASVFSQSGSSYRVDNFDFVNAVRIAAPPPPAATPLKRRGKMRSAGYSASPGTINAIINERMSEIKGATSMGGFTTGNATIDGFIVESGQRNAVDPLLLYAIMHQESTFKPRAMSNKGARGLMQLMPGTAIRFGVTSIWDPQQNIEGGSRYMRFLLDKFDGNVELALAGYNAGEGAVMKYGYRIPPYNETQEYVRRISKRYSLIRDPMAARNASLLTRDEVAANQKESAPLSMYERSVFAVKLPDGRLQLITQ